MGRVGKKFKHAAAHQGYGLTETNGAICGISGEEYVARPTSCGQPFPIVDLCVVDPDSADATPLPPGVRGELLIRSSLVMSHYWNKEGKTRESIIALPASAGNASGGGWFRTGDIAVLDEENYIFIVDRKKDLIIRGGENISCSEVETAFYENEAILECAAFNLIDERLGERVGFAVVLKTGSGGGNCMANEPVATELIDAVRKRQALASFKIPLPRDVYFFSETLPRGATGKILKRALREQCDPALQTPASKL